MKPGTSNTTDSPTVKPKKTPATSSESRKKTPGRKFSSKETLEEEEPEAGTSEDTASPAGKSEKKGAPKKISNISKKKPGPKSKTQK